MKWPAHLQGTGISFEYLPVLFTIYKPLRPSSSKGHRTKSRWQENTQGPIWQMTKWTSGKKWGHFPTGAFFGLAIHTPKAHKLSFSKIKESKSRVKSVPQGQLPISFLTWQNDKRICSEHTLQGSHLPGQETFGLDDRDLDRRVLLSFSCATKAIENSKTTTWFLDWRHVSMKNGEICPKSEWKLTSDRCQTSLLS